MKQYKTEWFEHDLGLDQPPTGQPMDVKVPPELLEKGVKVVGHEYTMDWSRNKCRFRIVYSREDQ